MQTEKQKILELLEKGQITAQEAAQLLDCLPDESTQQAQQAQEPERTQPQAAVSDKGKKLRIEVTGDAPELKKMDVNVSLPLGLAKLADNIIENCLPHQAKAELKKQGIDLEALNLGGIIAAMENYDEDIINADINGENMKLKVRIHVA